MTNGIEENSVRRVLRSSQDRAKVKKLRRDNPTDSVASAPRDSRPLDLTTKDASGFATLPTIFYSSLEGTESMSWAESLKRKKFAHPSEDNEDISEFHLSCTLQDPGFARALLDNGADVNGQAPPTSRLYPGFTPLHFAVKGCSVKVIDLLLKRGADPNRQDAAGRTPLHWVCEGIDGPFSISTEDAKVIAGLLLAHKASPVVADAEGRTPLHTAFYFNLHETDGACAIFDQLIEATTWGASNHTDARGLSLLHIASSAGFDEAVTGLLDAGAEVDSRVASGPYAGFTALHFAAMNNRSAVVDVLVRSDADANAREDLTGGTPLHLACKRLHQPDRGSPLSVINSLVRYGASSVAPDGYGRTPLHECFYASDSGEGKKAFLKLLSAMKLQLDNFTDEHGLSVFHMICTTRKFLLDFADLDVDGCPASGVFAGYTGLHFACMFNHVKAVKFLLEKRAKVNAKAGEAGVTPLHLACEFTYRKFLQDDVTTAEGCCADQVEIIDLLLSHGADVHARDSLGSTPLHYACMLDKNHNEEDWDKLHEQMPSVASNLFKEVGTTLQQIIPAFVSHNVDVGARSRDDSTILHLVARYGSLQILEEVINLLVLLGIDLNATDAAGQTPLHIAVRSGNKGLVRSLLENNADPNVKCKESAIPLHIVCQQIIDLTRGGKASAKNDSMKDKLLIFRVLLENGSDVNVKMRNGGLLLHEAIKAGVSSLIAKSLLRYRADIDMKDSSGQGFMYYLYKQTKPRIQKFTKFLDLHLSWHLALAVPLKESDEKNYCLNKINLDYKSAVMDYDDRFDSDSTYSKCRMELKRMNEVQIESHTTLYDILRRHPQLLVNLVENKDVVKIMKAGDLELKYPYYGHLLKVQFKRGLTRRIYAAAAETALCSVLNLYLPNLCSQKILEYLPNADVHNLMKAAPLKKGEKRKLCDV